MMEPPRRITLDQWDDRYRQLRAAGLREPAYGGSLRRHVSDGDLRLLHLQMDNSAAALRLCNFLLTEEERLHQARAAGKKLVGTLKDLGTVPVIAYAMEDIVAFYPDGAWWIPCIMEQSAGLLKIADSLGIDDSFCPVRAMLGAFISKSHFPIPELLICSVGATCDDLSAIAQRLDRLGHPVFWWEIPHRREVEPDEAAVSLPGGCSAPESQVTFVRGELTRVRRELESYAQQRLTTEALRAGIERANHVRRLLRRIRQLIFTAALSPLPALELLIAEMLALHFCSDQKECLVVLETLLEEIERRIAAGIGLSAPDAARLFWLNPVADLRAMNLLEDAGGRICGTEYLFSHALDPIPEDLPPMEALAQTALADPMVGSPAARADRVCREMHALKAEALVISRIPGASHCAMEGMIIGEIVRRQLGVPAIELEVPPLTDSMEPTLLTRLEALVETVRNGRKR
jgi:benzoyl-CoA reductase/2-hydroxyglutaryl-CoA dehydratase subunit BcrC/BadD/HgdB